MAQQHAGMVVWVDRKLTEVPCQHPCTTHTTSIPCCTRHLLALSLTRSAAPGAPPTAVGTPSSQLCQTALEPPPAPLAPLPPLQCLLPALLPRLRPHVPKTLPARPRRRVLAADAQRSRHRVGRQVRSCTPMLPAGPLPSKPAGTQKTKWVGQGPSSKESGRQKRHRGSLSPGKKGGNMPASAVAATNVCDRPGLACSAANKRLSGTTKFQQQQMPPQVAPQDIKQLLAPAWRLKQA